MKIAIYTLGCKVNQYETQAMETILRQRGHELVEFEEPADAYIVNGGRLRLLRPDLPGTVGEAGGGSDLRYRGSDAVSG